MKRLRPIKLLVTLAAVLIPAALSAVNTIIHTATYGSSGLTLGTDTLGGVTYTTVSYGDLYSDGDAGMPSLPLMERAARACSEYCTRFPAPFNRKHPLKGPNRPLFCVQIYLPTRGRIKAKKRPRDQRSRGRLPS